MSDAKYFALPISYFMIEEILVAVGLSQGGKRVCYFTPLSLLELQQSAKNTK